MKAAVLYETDTHLLEGVNDAFEALAKGEVARSVLDLP